MNDTELRQLALKMAIDASLAQCAHGDTKAMYSDILMKRVDAFYKFLTDTEEVKFDDRGR